MPYLPTQVHENGARIHENNDTTSANLFYQYSDDNELSLHDRILNLIRNEDHDTFTDQKFNNYDDFLKYETNQKFNSNKFYCIDRIF